MVSIECGPGVHFVWGSIFYGTYWIWTPHRIWTPGSNFYDGGPYSIIELMDPRVHILQGIWTQGPFSLGSILYMTAAQVCVCCDVLPRHSARLSQSLVGLCGGKNIYFWKLTIDEGIFANYGFVHCGANWNTGFLSRVWIPYIQRCPRSRSCMNQYLHQNVRNNVTGQKSHRE